VPEGQQKMPKIALAVNRAGRGNTQVENQQRHGHGEDAVAQRSEPFDALACNAVVEGQHRMGV